MCPHEHAVNDWRLHPAFDAEHSHDPSRRREQPVEGDYLIGSGHAKHLIRRPDY